MAEVVDVLLDLPEFRDPPTRSVIVGELDPQISARIPRHVSIRLDVIAIVRTCLYTPGGLAALVDVLTLFCGDTHTLARLRELVENLSLPQGLQEDERRSLVAFLSSVPGRPWLSAYLGAAGPVVQRLPDNPGEALAVLEDLRAPRGGEPRVLRFTRALVESCHVPERLRDEVRGWSARLAHRLRLPLPDYGPVRPADEDALLVLSLQPYLPRGESCLVSAWLGYGRDGWLPLVQEDEPRPLSQVPPMLSGFMAVVRDYTGGRPPKRVEFLLPRSLLGLPVDQWVTDGRSSAASPPELALGVNCSVVVRDLERATDPSSRSEWSRRWSAYNANGALPEHEVLWLGPDRRPVQSGPPAVPSAVCAMVLEHPSNTVTADALATALDAGVPVVLWDRRTGPADHPPRGRFHWTMHDLMYGGRSEHLPERVRSLRAEALRSAEMDWGRHIALLWDDPTRTIGGGGALRWP
ncbi:effector-associated domain 2-containing protein [Actinacidiphila alni]|uniref:VMAP-C domain-containing protein n=1 Tax=Actinacidiphila alni TaxID=380248 RepID=UPI003454A4D8